jgi:ubiquinone/menaquinone biosynthesis C-methylase UbiE
MDEFTTNDFEEALGGEEYDLFPKAVPYHDAMQEAAASIVKQYASGLGVGGIRLGVSGIELADIGCGTGITTALLLDADPRVAVAAIDRSQKMLDRAAVTLQRYGSRVSFVKDDALAYLRKQDASSVDAIVTVFALHNDLASYRRDVYPELHRVLRPGGIFVTGDKIAYDDELLHAQSLEYELSCLSAFDGMGRPDQREHWTAHYLHDDGPAYRLTERELVSGLSRAGFVDIERPFRLHMDAVITARKS